MNMQSRNVLNYALDTPLGKALMVAVLVPGLVLLVLGGLHLWFRWHSFEEKVAYSTVETAHEKASTYNDASMPGWKAHHILPVRNNYLTITSHFKETGAQRNYRPHAGVDIATIGTKDKHPQILASEQGWVTFAGKKGGYGNFIEIYHPDGTRSRYGHLQEIFVHPKQYIHQGHIIGRMGNTGRVRGRTGIHLHYEQIDAQGYTRNPELVGYALLKNGNTINYARSYHALLAARYGNQYARLMQYQTR